VLFLDVLEAAFEGWPQVRGVSYGPFGIDAEGLRHFGKVYLRIIDVSPDAGILYRTIAELRDFHPMLLRVVVGLIVVHDHEEWDAMFGRSP